MNNLNADILINGLPDVITGDMRKLARAIAKELAKQFSEADKIKMYTRIDELDEGLLDILAVDLKVDWWDFDYSLEEKRQTLKKSWLVRSELGTKRAVEIAVGAVYPNAKVSEWFEYGGEPYKFKLLIDATYENADPVKHSRVLDRINFYKNKRSHLEGIEYTAQPNGNAVGFFGISVCGLAIKLEG